MRATPETMNADNAALLDEFCDAVWLEDGLAKNTLESYRRDLRLFAEWLEKERHAALAAATEADLAACDAVCHSSRWRRDTSMRHSVRMIPSADTQAW